MASAESAQYSDGLDAIDRVRLLQVLDGGMGRFLQGIETTPVFANADSGRGAFVGFRIERFAPSWVSQDALDQAQASSPVVRGDVVTAINGKPIERPEQAFSAFEALREADVLEVSIVREGTPATVRLPIVEASER